jgi:hypothetical protein
MSSLAAFCLFCLSMTSPPVPQMPEWGWSVTYRHEMLPSGRHLLRMSTTDLLIDSGKARKERLMAFAKDYAGQFCGGRFTVLDGDSLTTYERQVVFRCRR